LFTKVLVVTKKVVTKRSRTAKD